MRGNREVARLDLAIEDSKTAIEYDGRWHLDPTQAAHDKERRRRLEAEGWANIVVTADDLAGDPGAIVKDVRSAHERG